MKISEANFQQEELFQDLKLL